MGLWTWACKQSVNNHSKLLSAALWPIPFWIQTSCLKREAWFDIPRPSCGAFMFGLSTGVCTASHESDDHHFGGQTPSTRCLFALKWPVCSTHLQELLDKGSTPSTLKNTWQPSRRILPRSHNVLTWDLSIVLRALRGPPLSRSSQLILGPQHPSLVAWIPHYMCSRAGLAERLHSALAYSTALLDAFLKSILDATGKTIQYKMLRLLT